MHFTKRKLPKISILNTSHQEEKGLRSTFEVFSPKYNNLSYNISHFCCKIFMINLIMIEELWFIFMFDKHNHQNLIKMRNIFCCIALLVLISTSATAQDRTEIFYYDKDWKGVPNEVLATYKRIAYYPKDSHFAKSYRDYYINSGKMQGEGKFISIDKYDDKNSIFDGQNFGYDENGNKVFEANYKNGKLDGKCIKFFANGLVQEQSTFTEGVANGKYFRFDENGYFISYELSNGQEVKASKILGMPNGSILHLNENYEPIYEDAKTDETYNISIKGNSFQCHSKNGIDIGICAGEVQEYGKYIRYNIIIQNNLPFNIDINPELFYSKILTKKQEVIDNKVLTYEDYQRKVKNQQTWGMIGMGLAMAGEMVNSGMSSSTTTSTSNYNGNYSNYAYDNYGNYVNSYGNQFGSVTTTTNTTTYDAALAYQQNAMIAEKYDRNVQMFFDDRITISENYLRTHTLGPGEVLTGYILSERPYKNETLYLMIPFKNITYTFSWQK